MGAIKFVVALGAVVGLVGVFMPVVKVSDDAKAAIDKMADAAKKLGAPIKMGGMGGGGLIGQLASGSLWTVKSIPGAPGAVAGIVWGILGALAIVLLLAVMGILKNFGRGAAVGSFLLALAPAGLGTMLFMEAGKRGGAGMGSLLLMAGAGLAALAALVAIIKPEPKKA